MNKRKEQTQRIQVKAKRKHTTKEKDPPLLISGGMYVESGAKGVESGVKGVKSGAKGVISSGKGVKSGGKGVVSGGNGVKSGAKVLNLIEKSGCRIPGFE